VATWQSARSAIVACARSSRPSGPAEFGRQYARANNGDELLATLRRATHEIITPIVRYVGDLIDEMFRPQLARGFCQRSRH
jgi:hypothetical protein